jgi:hypothetical protein
MGPTDAVVGPDDTGNVRSLFLLTDGPEGPQTYTFLNITTTNTSIYQTSQMKFFSFSRLLSGGNHPITDISRVSMIAAAASVVWPNPHEDLISTGADTINLETGGILPVQFFWTNMVTHGFLMWLCWAIIIPIGFLWARFIKGYPNDKSALWFEGHRTLMSVGFIIVLVSASYAIGQTSSHLDSIHKIMGVTVVCCAVYQVMSAVMRPHADPTNPSPQRLLFEYTHHFIGRCTIVIAWVTIGYGLLLIPGIDMSVIWGHLALSVIWLVIAFILEIRKAIVTRRSREYESLNRR